MSGELQGLTAVVTGGSSGIGRAVVAELAARGADVWSLDLQEPAPGAPGESILVDLRNHDQVTAAVDQVGALDGHIDILVNNAGVSFVGTIEDGTEDDWHRVFDINVLGMVRSTRAALPYLRKANAPVIINMSSITATAGIAQRALYSATKGAIASMTRAMATDLIAEGIRVNAVAPGTVDTPFMEALALSDPDPAARREKFNRRQPTGRMVAPEEVAHAVAYLASPHAASTVGAVLMVDGGLDTVRSISP